MADDDFSNAQMHSTPERFAAGRRGIVRDVERPATWAGQEHDEDQDNDRPRSRQQEIQDRIDAMDAWRWHPRTETSNACRERIDIAPTRTVGDRCPTLPRTPLPTDDSKKKGASPAPGRQPKPKKAPKPKAEKPARRASRRPRRCRLLVPRSSAAIADIVDVAAGCGRPAKARPLTPRCAAIMIAALTAGCLFSQHPAIRPVLQRPARRGRVFVLPVLPRVKIDPPRHLAVLQHGQSLW